MFAPRITKMMGGRKLTTFSGLMIIVALTLSLVAPSESLQFCGKDLANALAIMCAETGYNMAFRQDPVDAMNDRRYRRDTMLKRKKRGIVDECCRSSCGWSTIESYCRPTPSSTTSENLQIQKRSDPLSDVMFKEKVKILSNAYHLDDTEGIRHQKRRLFGSTNDALNRKNNRVFHSTSENKRTGLASFSSKVKRNEKRKEAVIFEDGLSYQKGVATHNEALENDGHKARNNHIQGRHRHPNTAHHKSLKKGKGSQIGTVSPYFLGRTVVSPRGRRHPFLR